jgi:hypothetical protein
MNTALVTSILSSPVLITGYLLAGLATVTRLAPFTKPWWAWMPKALQAWLPALVATFSGAIPALANVHTWPDFLQALLVISAIPLALVGPGASSPHNHPELPPPAGTGGTGIDEKITEERAEREDKREEKRLASIRPPPPSKPPSKPPSVPPLGLLALCVTLVFGFALASCGLAASVWPAIVKCAPPSQAAIDAVTTALLAGGDVESTLATLGETYGVNIVLCIVNALSARWSAPGAQASPAVTAANLRAKAFLAKHPIQIEADQ